MVVIVGIVVCGCGRSAVDLSAEEILRLAESAYTSASTYRDQGVAELVVTTPDGEEGKVATTFTTVFRRPSDFRLTYRSSEGGWAHAILATDAGTESWVEGAEIPMPWETMADALRGTNAQSRGISILVPPLLFPGIGRELSLLNLTDTERLPDAEHGGGWRYVVRGRWYDNEATVWLDQRTHLVVRYELVDEEAGPGRTGRAKTTVRLEPEIGVDVPADSFRERLWDLDG